MPVPSEMLMLFLDRARHNQASLGKLTHTMQWLPLGYRLVFLEYPVDTVDQEWQISHSISLPYFTPKHSFKDA